MPETKAVRADIEVFYWYKKISDTETEVTQLLHLFAKASLPGFAKGMIAKTHLAEFKKLRNLIEEAD